MAISNILRFDEGRAEWELPMYQTLQAEGFATQIYGVKRRRSDG